ncbi:MAG TPA: hypothetical protein VM840_10055, partial [Actinomycetota bacterium]|nr:hypothetical protein [Actinomycetota bacterium]
MRRAVPSLLLLSLLWGATATGYADPTSPTPAGPTPPDGGTHVLVEGRGTAHGMGMAMDGVLGQARAGWTHKRIMDLFYTGTTPGKASGTVRVGLSGQAQHSVLLPEGGTVSDAPSGGSGPFPVRVPPGARVSVHHAPGGGYTVRLENAVRAAQVLP